MVAKCGIQNGQLVLLTKYPAEFSASVERPDRTIRWHDVADWIADTVAREAQFDPACRFLCDQFLDLLKRRNMALAAVNWQLKDGVLSFRNIMVMLQEAARGQRAKTDLYISLDFAGYTLDKRYWFGVSLDNPQLLQFGTRTRIDADKARSAGVGEVLETKDPKIPGGLRWWRVADLESEDVHFYSRSKEQIIWLETFLGECLVNARQIEITDSSIVDNFE